MSDLSEFKLISPYTFLNDKFYDEVEPAKFPKFITRYRSPHFEEFANLNNEQWINLFGKFESPMLPKIKNIAMRYHGHQFQVYNPDIGDGRGFTIAQFYKNNELYDLGTKGSGVTPYSRSGDGRLTLKGGVREVLCSNYLDALGVNTSKSLSLIETGEHLSRNDEPSPTRSSVLVRVSHSHLRIGTFQYHAFHQDTQSIEFLTNMIGKYYFNLNDQNNQPIKIFSEAVQRCATLAASYNVYGFVHGVLNTDNINITGESFDYGPYRFLEKYEPNKTAAYFDRFGLYRFSKQADAIFWNVQQLASIFTLMVNKEILIEEIKKFVDLYNQEVLRLFFKRLMIKPNSDSAKNNKILEAFYRILGDQEFFFEEVYYDLRGGSAKIKNRKDLIQKYQKYQLEKIFQNHDPINEINLNNLNLIPYETLHYNEIEKIWEAIDKNDDWSLFNNKIDSISKLKEANIINGLG